jgi:hypothetical protein
MENFNLKKFLIENKLTTNSRMLSEEVADKDIQIGAEYTAMLATDTKGGRTPVKVKVLGRDRNDETKVIVTPLQDVDYKNAESGQMNRFTKGSHYGSESKYLSESEGQVNENGTYTQKEILRGSMQGFKAPNPEELKVNMMIAPNMAYLGNQELLNQEMGRITAISGDKVTYKKGNGKLHNRDVADIIIVAS